MKKHLRYLARHQIGLVVRGTRDQHVGVCTARFGQHIRADTVAHDPAQVKARFQITQASAIGIDYRDVVFFAEQTFGNTFTDTACAQNKDFHNKYAAFATVDNGPSTAAS